MKIPVLLPALLLCDGGLRRRDARPCVSAMMDDAEGRDAGRRDAARDARPCVSTAKPGLKKNKIKKRSDQK
jgi:hypothetical protein